MYGSKVKCTPSALSGTRSSSEPEPGRSVPMPNLKRPISRVVESDVSGCLFL